MSIDSFNECVNSSDFDYFNDFDIQNKLLTSYNDMYNDFDYGQLIDKLKIIMKILDDNKIDLEVPQILLKKDYVRYCYSLKSKRFYIGNVQDIIDTYFTNNIQDNIIIIYNFEVVKIKIGLTIRIVEILKNNYKVLTEFDLIENKIYNYINDECLVYDLKKEDRTTKSR